jgi:choline-sulfatase
MTSRPNLLFIFSDQHAFNVAGCYGNPVAETPNLDSLAAAGVTFDAAYCPSPICVPSRMSMLTAQNPSRQDCWTNDDVLASDRPTWPHALGVAGYRPTLIGRLHSMGADQLRGYVEREVGDHSPNWAGVPRHDMGVLNETNNPEPVSVVRSGPGRTSYELKDHDVTRAAVARLDRIGAARRAGDAAPFALTVGYMLPHPPYVAARADYDRFAGRVPPPRLPPASPSREHPWLSWWRGNRGIVDVDPADAIRSRVAYYALTYRLDAMIGEVLAALDRNGLRENTLIVYASDHGDQIGERRSQIVNLIDLSATMLDALGAPPLPSGQGRSFLAVAKDGAAPWVDETVSEYCTDTVPAWTGGMAVRQRMLRAGRWKLIYYHGYPPQLFDLASDPDEMHDLAGDPAHAAVRERLLERLLADWSPDDIDRRMKARRRDKDLLGAWARNTHPPSTQLWPTQPDQNSLDI